MRPGGSPTQAAIAPDSVRLRKAPGLCAQPDTTPQRPRKATMPRSPTQAREHPPVLCLRPPSRKARPGTPPLPPKKTKAGNISGPFLPLEGTTLPRCFAPSFRPKTPEAETSARPLSSSTAPSSDKATFFCARHDQNGPSTFKSRKADDAPKHHALSSA